MEYKGYKLNVSFTNADVLEAFGHLQNDVKDELKKLDNNKSIDSIVACIRNTGSLVKSFVEACDGDFDGIFPKADIKDYFSFIKAVSEHFAKADFSDIKLD